MVCWLFSKSPDVELRCHVVLMFDYNARTLWSCDDVKEATVGMVVTAALSKTVFLKLGLSNCYWESSGLDGLPVREASRKDRALAAKILPCSTGL